ncbi:hypothetical protein [Phycicoccus sonneratiae]|uniref:PH domain-containing protein n=1 Tax=Phycicoccus sonneratiae TaxID=2807628 RepID=A0ABS2CKX8_9MICO|nr:hypothetical protein [Phycicoccus sonneraticus]MBM6400552.1 hypothetical protein [Phycicoccus sonneraticus]
MSGPQRGELPTRVVITAPAWVRLISLPLMLAFWVGCVMGLVGLVRDGAGEDTPLLAAVVGWVLVLFFVLVIPPAAWFVLRYRTVLDVEGDRVERQPGAVSVPVSTLRELRALPPSTLNRANRGARVQVIGENGGVVAQVDESMRQWPAALAVLRAWARRDPSLVEGDYSRAALLGSDA